MSKGSDVNQSDMLARIKILFTFIIFSVNETLILHVILEVKNYVTNYVFYRALTAKLTHVAFDDIITKL